MKNKSAVIILNGTEFNKNSFMDLVSKDFFMIAVDGGINHLKETDIKIDVHIGDMDSVFSLSDFNIITSKVHPKNKDRSDFDLSLEFAIENGITDATVYAATGGRLDHFLSNYESAVKFAAKGMRIVFVGTMEKIFFINKPEKFKFPINSTVSIFSGTEISKNIILKGFEYEIEDIDLYKNTPLGLSNIVLSKEQFIGFDEGIIVILVNI